MYGFYRRETRFLKILPFFVLFVAFFLLLTKVAWTIFTPTDFTCFAPTHFSEPQVRYTNEACASRGKLQQNFSEILNAATVRNEIEEPNRAAVNTIFFLLYLALLLSVPLAIGDALNWIVLSTRKTRYKDVSMLVAIVRVVIMILTRLATGVFLIVAAYYVRNFEVSRYLYSKVITSASINFLSSDFYSIFQEKAVSPIFCEMSIPRLGRIDRYKMVCNVKYGPHVLVSKVLVFFTWIVIVPALVWIMVNSVNILILLLIPSSRKFQLAINEELAEELNRNNRDRYSEVRKLDRID